MDIILEKELALGDEELFKLSIKKQKSFLEQLLERTADYISTTLKDKIKTVLGDVVQIYTDEEYAEANPEHKPKIIDNKNLHVTYDKATADIYLRPDILLEISVMSAWIPNEPREISSYVAEVYPQLDITPAIVPTIRPERTFWDKVTILRREFYRPETKYSGELDMNVQSRTPTRYSQHYYDLYQMGHSWVKDAAFANMELLADVVDRKNKL